MNVRTSIEKLCQAILYAFSDELLVETEKFCRANFVEMPEIKLEEHEMGCLSEFQQLTEVDDNLLYVVYDDLSDPCHTIHLIHVVYQGQICTMSEIWSKPENDEGRPEIKRSVHHKGPQ